ncbi:MAG: hypothetical protein ACREJM_05895, partial [Candidatus Saccharimonadales bacterium]
METAERGEFDPTLPCHPSNRFSARGVFHKRGKKVRMSIEYGGHVALPGAQNMFANSSADEVTNGVVNVLLSAEDAFTKGEASFDTASRAGLKPGAAGILTSGVLNPIHPN